MNRVTKLLVLIVLSLSVYFIFQNTKEKTIKIISLADSLSLGINSFGVREYSYLNYYEDYLKNKNIEVTVINNYSKKDLTIHELIGLIKNNNTLKRDLRESNILFLNVGYNDLLYKLSLEDEVTSSKLNRIIDDISIEYNKLLKEIKKYYKNEIVVIGYPKSNKDNYYYNIGIRKLNNVINTGRFINTYSLLNNRNKYFSNPNSYYPNRQGYEKIYEEIQKTLDK